MPGETTELVFRVVGENLEVLDQAGNKLGEISTKANAGGAAFAQLQAAAAEAAKAVQALGAISAQANAGVGGLAESSVKASQGLDQVRGKAEGFGQTLGVGTQSLTGFSTATTDATGRLSGLGKGLEDSGKEATGALAALRGYVGGVTAAQIAAGGLVVGVGAVGYAMQASARENIRRVDELNNISTATGLTVRELSQLEYVARRNQVEVGALGGGFQALNRSIAEAANGAGRDARVFKALDVDVRDANGSLRSGVDVYRDVADALKELPPGVEKSAAAAVLFAGNHEAMLKVMKGGSAEFDKLIGQADALGYSLDQGTIASATRTTDALSRVTTAAYGFGVSLGQPILGPVADTVEAFADLIEGANELARIDPSGFWERTADAALDAIPILKEAVGLYRLMAGTGIDFLDVKSGGTTTVGADAPKGTDDRRRRALADALGRPDRAGASSAAAEQRRFEQLTDQSLLGAAQARATAAGTAVALAEQDLAIFERRLELEGTFATTQSQRVALLDAAQQQELALAQRIDEAKARELDAQIAILEARKQDHDVVEAASKGLTGQLDLLNAQQDALRIQQDLLQGSGGQAARVADEYARARAELQAANRVVVNLGDTVNSSLQRAVDGVFNSGSGGFEDIVENGGKAIASSLVGGFLEAQLKKAEFDAMIGENFTVTLPGFMETGASQIKSIWSDAMDFLGFSAQEAGDDVSRKLGDSFQQAGQSAVSLGNTVNGVARNTYGAVTLGRDATGRYVVENEFGQRFSSASEDAALDAAGGSPTPAAGGGGGAAGAVLGAAGGLLVAVQAIVAAFDAIEQLKGTVELGNTISEGDIRETGARAAFGTIGLGGVGGILDGTPQAARVAIATIFNPLGLIFELPGVLQAPTQGSQIKEGLSKAIDRANLPQQSVLDIDNQGVRSKFLEVIPDAATAERFAAAGFGGNVPGLRQPTLDDFRPGRIQETIERAAVDNPEVEAFRTRESLALGVLTTGTLRGGTLVANSLTSNLLLQGVSEKEARRQTRKLAEQQGINLATGVEEAQRLYTEGVFKDDPLTAENEKLLQLTTTIDGVVSIFQDDIPAGVNVSAIAFANFTEAVGVDVAEFTEDLERALDIFGRLEETQEAGLRGGLDVAVDSLARRNQLLAAGGPVNEIIRANLDARRGLVSSLYDSVSTGFSTALTDGLQDAIQDSPAWRALTEQIANAVNGAPIGDLPLIINDLIGQSLPQIEATAQALAIVRGQLGVTPTALFGSADAIRESVKDARFDLLNPRQQEASLKNELAVIDEKIAALQAGGVTPDEALVLRPLLDRRTEIGFDLAGNASQRYAPGSQVGRNAIEYGLSVAEETAALFENLGDAQQPLIDSTTANTSAVDRNTEALNNNTAAQPGGGAGTNAPVGAGAAILVVDASGAPITGDGERRLRAFVNEMIASGKLTAPARGKLREIGGTR